MWIPASLHRMALQAAADIDRAFRAYEDEFQSITRRARRHFEGRDWHAMQRDALERLELYAHVVSGLVADLRQRLDSSEKDRKIWAIMKAAYSDLIRHCDDLELAETFFNSITRRIFTTIGIDPRIEFLFSDFDAPRDPGEPVFQTYRDGELAALIGRVLASRGFAVPFEDPERDARRVAEAIENQRRESGLNGQPVALELIDATFYRNQGAYLVGRVRFGDGSMPLCLALQHPAGGIVVDAALLTPDEVSVVFSFTRSYFHVEVRRPRDLVDFLKSIMPRKPLAELYNAIGYNKHGKTEIFRDLVRHIDDSSDRFDIAPGDRGMVMSVFTLPSFDVVFKVIRDRFAYPKTSTRRDVMDRYQLVFKHDRAGRLADVQEFEHLAFPRERFTEGLLEELATETADTVGIGEHLVEFRHLYVERRMIPLNLYIREAPLPAAREAVVDYGRAVKDLAAMNIFPGDMLLKNFGVTRHGRVVFYDYDELCHVTDCQFREMPAAQAEDDEMGAEPWFYVGPHDIFPEEFIHFMGLGGELREAFLAEHRDLLTARYWNQLQARLRAGELLDIFPYPVSRRLESVSESTWRISTR